MALTGVSNVMSLAFMALLLVEYPWLLDALLV